jgi:cytidylate kinase
MPVITISRELGSGGDEIANLLCDQLGFCRVDKAMLSKIAEEAGVDVKAVLAKERDVVSKPKLISDQMTSLYGRQPAAFGRKSELDDQTYTRVVRETMEKLAQQDNAIIIGRGGQMVLRDWPGALHVHLYAVTETRVQRLMERYNITRLDAERRIERSDDQKRLFVRNMHKNANWKDPKYYHLIIDTGHFSPETAAQIIIVAARGQEATTS